MKPKKSWLQHTKNQIYSDKGLRELKTSSVFEDMQGEPSLIPIFIGVYRRKDTFYRVVVNGVTGKLIGEAPIDWIKISLMIAVLFFIGFIVANIQ